MLVMLQSDVLYAVMMSVYMPINNLKPVHIMRDACRCSVNCEQCHKIICARSSEKCRATCVLHASYISLDMHRMSCMSIDINVEQHLLPRTNMHVLGGMHPTCRMHVNEIVHMLSNGAVYSSHYSDMHSTCRLHAHQ